MKLAKLLAAVGVTVDSDVEITGINNDSRAIQAGDLYVAVTGDGGDGLRYAGAAIEAGARAVAIDPALHLPVALGVPVVEIENLQQQLGTLAAALCGHPSEALRLLGVTGTNGKTTVAHLYAQAADAAGKKCGQIGTLGYGFADALAKPTHTTPLAPRVQQLLADMRDDGATDVIMEVSSHALAQNRVGGCQFHTAIFTNLSRDHLDYHGDMASYGEAKAKLFGWPGLAAVVVNADDEFGAELLARVDTGIERIAYALNPVSLEHLPRDIHRLLAEVFAEPEGLRLKVSGSFGEIELNSSLMGTFNAANLLAALGGLLADGMELPVAANALQTASTAMGRMELVAAGEKTVPLPTVLVDYAHTPDALTNALQSAKAHAAGKLWCVFGCGGDRDTGKRPEMGAAAENEADFTVVTSDNPRSEKPVAIADGICAGMRDNPTHIELDRSKAIFWAIARAAPEDTVLIAGKGHEDYQETKGTRLPFSDHQQAADALAARAAGSTGSQSTETHLTPKAGAA